MKSQKGISLIALIITIIVIIILAAIVIGGVFNTPNDAKFANFCQEYDRVQTAVKINFYNLYQKYALQNSVYLPNIYGMYNEVATGDPASDSTISSDTWVKIPDAQWGNGQGKICTKPILPGDWFIRLSDGKLAYQGFEKEVQDIYYTPTAHLKGDRNAIKDEEYFNGLTAESAADSDTQSGMLTLVLNES